MKTTILFLLLSLGAAPALLAQSSGNVAGPVETSPSDRFVLRNGEVMLLKGKNLTPLTKNILLSNGTKINSKSGIVELPGGKMTTLKEGDYVRPNGDIVFATPASAAQARGDNTVPAAAQFNSYVDPRPAPATPAAMEIRLTEMNSKISLMAEKIQLLNQKISLLGTSGQPKVDTSALDRQLQAIDAKLK
ncbi:DUF6799 domain-containing protein [Hymenobacter rubripertinctus]|uniref:DUF6799 domain-containing protein n=1 Tax=Hymenobacter rubripertinctus TaxID=2029981 RepID=A0A418QSV7_9BACT|nr:DUF6799 domain-containing protein [Hymenobacter rubripertinctus]RIY08214.1 hypothetical protein D0T11_15005 [Hymenobacter rubripertinctus]